MIFNVFDLLKYLVVFRKHICVQVVVMVSFFRINTESAASTIILRQSAACLQESTEKPIGVLHLELRCLLYNLARFPAQGHLVMFQRATLQGQTGLQLRLWIQFLR